MPDAILATDCAQPYCTSCVNKWVKVKVEEMSPTVPCLAPGCKKLLEDSDLKVRLVNI